MIAETPACLDTNAIRADFPILSQHVRDDKPLVYLDNAATTQRPRQVIDALVDIYEHHYANVHRGIHWLSDQVDRSLRRRPGERRGSLSVPRDRQEIIFTHGSDRGDQSGGTQLGRRELACR